MEAIEHSGFIIQNFPSLPCAFDDAGQYAFDGFVLLDQGADAFFG
jgi:hypothetical protein